MEALNASPVKATTPKGRDAEVCLVPTEIFCLHADTLASLQSRLAPKLDIFSWPSSPVLVFFDPILTVSSAPETCVGQQLLPCSFQRGLDVAHGGGDDWRRVCAYWAPSLRTCYTCCYVASLLCQPNAMLAHHVYLERMAYFAHPLTGRKLTERDRERQRETERD